MDQRSDILKNIKRRFIHRDNPHGHSVSNDRFQRDLEGRLDVDPEYRTQTIEKLQEHIARLIYKWKKDHHESIAHSTYTGAYTAEGRQKEDSTHRRQSLVWLELNMKYST